MNAAPDKALHLVRVLPGTPEQVWSALTTADGLARWWWVHWAGVSYQVEARVGGSYRIEAGAPGIAVHGRYLELDAPRRVAMTWVWVENGVDGPTEQVELLLEPGPGSGTTLRLRHTGPWADQAPAAAYREGWEFVLTALERLLAQPEIDDRDEGQRSA